MQTNPPQIDFVKSRRMYSFLVAFCVATSLLAVSESRAQNIQIQISADQISIDDRLRINIVINGRYQALQGPALDDWHIVSQGQEIRRVNRTKRTTHRLTLVPRRTGSLLIGAAHLIYQSEVVASSAPIQIEVKMPEAISAQEATDLNVHRNKELFIHTNLSDLQPYEGEPIVLGFDVYVQSHSKLKDTAGVSTAEFSGFAVTDISRERNLIGRDTLWRRPYYIYKKTQYLLVPLNPGIHTLDSIKMNVLIDEVFRPLQRMLKSQRFDLEVLPIPEEGRPDSYRAGNIGNFSIRTNIENQEIRLGKREIFTITVTGRGNLRSLKEPQIPKIPGLDIERLEGDELKGVNLDVTGMHGKVVFTYMVTPRRVGEINIPAIPLGFFDPANAAFHETQSQPMTLKIPGRANATSLPSGTTRGGHGNTGERTGQSQDEEHALRPLSTTLEETQPAPLTVPEDNAFLSGGQQRLFWFLLGFPPLLFLLQIGLDRSRDFHVRGAPQRRERGALSIAQTGVRRLRKQKKHPNAETFYQGVSNVITTYLANRLGLSPSAMTRTHLEDWLHRHGYPDDLVSDLLVEMENCDFARFAPTSNQDEDMRTCLDRTRDLLQRIHEHAKGVSYV